MNNLLHEVMRVAEPVINNVMVVTHDDYFGLRETAKSPDNW